MRIYHCKRPFNDQVLKKKIRMTRKSKNTLKITIKPENEINKLLQIPQSEIK